MENNEKPKEGKLENEKQVEGSKPTGSEKEKNNQKEESKATLPTKSPVPPESTKKEEEARYLLFFVYGETTPIDRGDIFDLIDQLNKIPTPPEQTRIDMIILSGGGYPHPAYQMVNIIRSRCKKLKAIVPLYAKSAATLMTLGSDEIVMGAQSELGPLDMQMQHPLIENLHISALDLCLNCQLDL
jgi:ClpP class serine protease